MDNHEAQRREAEGRQILEQLGGVALTYAFGCQLPETVDGHPISELERLWYDQFDHAHREWLIVLNGYADGRPIKSVGMTLEGGAGLVVCDNKVLAKLTPLGEQWYADPDTGERFQQGRDEEEVSYFRTQILEAMYWRLTTTGKDLPPLEEIRDGE